MDECARMGCERPAVALLSFAPQHAKAWLYDFREPDASGSIALCRKHANATVVPVSWQLVDSRDPAWPGPMDAATDSEAPPVPNIIASVPLDEQISPAPPLVTLPSDSVGEEEFAALSHALPVTPVPYVEPLAATLRAAGVQTGEDGPDAGAGEAALFELPLSDAPAVTAHPGY